MKVKQTIILFICCILVVSFIASIMLAYEFKSSSYPYWSPDGERISFVSIGKYNPLSTEVWVMDSSGNNEVQLTSFGSADLYTFDPWSPDGTKLLYTSDSTGSCELWVMNADGSNKKQLTEGAYLDNYFGLRGWDASWSPDGTQIVYVSASSKNKNVWENVEIDGREETIFNISNVCKDSDIWIIGSDGTNNIKLTNNGKQNLRPKSQPKGEKIAFLSNTSGNGGIWVMNKDGSNKNQLEDGLLYDIEWSPDGTKIVYVKEEPENFTSNIWTMSADGTNRIPLTNTSEYFICQHFPEWSPDGTKIVFNSGTTGEYEMWVINSDGTGQTKIGDGMAPQWSPKGDKIAFMELKDNRFTISVIILDEDLASAPATTVAYVPDTAKENTEKSSGFGASITLLTLFLLCKYVKKRN